MRRRSSKLSFDLALRGLGAFTHVQRFGGHPVGVDADQRKSSNSHLAQDGAADAGSAQ